MSFIREFWAFARARKKYWLVPLVVVLLLFAIVIVVAENSIAPFIYTLF